MASIRPVELKIQLSVIDALKEALALIESYEQDIRDRGLGKEGFCQGVIYKESTKKIKSIMNQMFFPISPEDLYQVIRHISEDDRAQLFCLLRGEFCFDCGGSAPCSCLNEV